MSMIFEMPYFKQQIADEHEFIKVPGIYRHFQRERDPLVHQKGTRFPEG